MPNGTIRFRAAIRGNGLTFSPFDFNPNEPGVEKIEIEGNYQDEIRTVVHLSTKRSHADAQALAMKVNTAALNRIAFNHDLTIESAKNVGAQFESVDSQSGNPLLELHDVVYAQDAIRIEVGIDPSHLKAELEGPPRRGERNYGLLRSARQSASPVEEFIHLYNLLLMILGDKQKSVEAFIVREEPTVPRTQSPKYPRVRESVYTRLRNELAHPRPGTNIESTKTEMAARLHGLIALTKRAIELHP
jgi:hypothetical protein